MRRPDANDSRNLLLEADGGDGAADFYLLRFDALQGRVCVLALPRELLAGERGDARQTLGGLAAYAGPGLAAARLAAAGAVCLLVANCGSANKLSSRVDPKYGVSSSPRVVEFGDPVPKGGGTYRVGKPYVVAGKTYVPEEDPNYRA